MANELTIMAKERKVEDYFVLESNMHCLLLDGKPYNHVSCGILTVKHTLPRYVQEHSLPYMTYNTVFAGKGQLEYYGKHYELSPGFSFIRYAGERFTICRTADYVEFAIALPADFGALLKKYHAPKPLCALYPLTAENLEKKRFFYDAIRKTHQREAMLSATEMFHYIVSEHYENDLQEETPAEAFTEKASRLLRKHLYSVSPTEKAAAELGMGYESFRKKFKASAGISPGQYVVKHKFSQSLTMLFNGRRIDDIAEALGYAETPVFSRQFKKIYGMSPAQYRRVADPYDGFK